MKFLASLIISFGNTHVFSIKAKEPPQKGDFSLSKALWDRQEPQPLTFNPALTTCASERIKTFRFLYFSDFAARKHACVLGKICYLKKVHLDFFDT